MHDPRAALQLRRHIERWDEKIHAFVALDETAPDGSPGNLGDVTVGVKDVIDVKGLPTRNGSDAFAAAAAATTDANVVAALRAAGARIIGKTTTTEFAFTDPTDCRNPHDLRRSPGGSSSGSGAAVAAGLVDIALGTQTAGSLCRPAAYCGAVGFKPTYGVFERRGVTPLAPSFDTIGVIARTVALAERAFSAMKPGADNASARDPAHSIMAATLLDPATAVPPDTSAAFLEAREALGGICHETRAPKLSIEIAGVVTDHRMVMNHEAHAAHGHLLSGAAARLLKPKFRAGLEGGATITPSAAEAARNRLAEARRAFWSSMEAIDVILTLPVPDGAPMLDGTTGFQDWLTPWTVFGGPLLCLPWGMDSLGRPRSVMLAGRPGEDEDLLAVAARLEAVSPVLPRPQLPE